MNLGPDKCAIRGAKADDIEAVSAIDASITDLSKPDYWADMFARYGNRENRFFLIAEDQNQKLIGFIIGEVRAWEFGSKPCGWVFAIGVDPQTRLNKVGSSLFLAICDCLAKAGVDTVRTMLARDDELNMTFFRSQGMMGGSFIQLEMPVNDRAGG